MYPFTTSLYDKLIESGSQFTEHNDFPPVCKISLTGSDNSWLINGLDPDEPDIAFGISDLGIGHPELSFISINELKQLENDERKPVCEYIETNLPISAYARAASEMRRIEISEEIVKGCNPRLNLAPQSLWHNKDVYSKYFTDSGFQQLIQNGTDQSEAKDYPPIAKLFMTNTACTWLISELDPEMPQIAFGLCDLGMGFPELGYVDLSEVEEAQDVLRYLERDTTFEGKFPISVYARAARKAGYIVTDEHVVRQSTPTPK